MILCKDYVERLSERECHAIIASFEHYETAGFIGEAPIRQHARAFLSELGQVGNQTHVLFWVGQIANECYRRFYRRHYPRGMQAQPEPNTQSQPSLK